MSGESIAGFPSSSGHGAALTARALHAVADNATGADAQLHVVGVDAHWPQPYVVGGTSLWWQPLPHERSLTRLGSVVNTSIIV